MKTAWWSEHNHNLSVGPQQQANPTLIDRFLNGVWLAFMRDAVTWKEPTQHPFTQISHRSNLRNLLAASQVTSCQNL